jgi:hypothetical protein
MGCSCAALPIAWARQRAAVPRSTVGTLRVRVSQPDADSARRVVAVLEAEAGEHGGTLGEAWMDLATKIRSRFLRAGTGDE